MAAENYVPRAYGRSHPTGRSSERATIVRAPTSSRGFVPKPRRIGPQIDNQAADTDPEPGERIFQRHDRGDAEKAESRDRPDMHDPAHRRRNRVRRLLPVNELPDQADIGRV